MTRTLLLLALCALPAFAQEECTDNFTECKEDCVIEFGGSIRVEVKKQYDKCMKKCTKVANRCTERALEVKNNMLEHDALDGTPGSDEVDKDNMPTRTASKKKKKVADDESSSSSSSDDDAPAPKKEALAEEEVPRSERTRLKTDDKPAPAPKKSEDTAVTVREVPGPKKAEVIEMKLSPRKETSEDLRDDGPRAEAKKPAPRDEEEAPPPPKKPKKEEAPPKRVEEDHDDLRNY